MATTGRLRCQPKTSKNIIYKLLVIVGSDQGMSNEDLVSNGRRYCVRREENRDFIKDHFLQLRKEFPMRPAFMVACTGWYSRSRFCEILKTHTAIK